MVESVRILVVPPGLVDGLPEEEASFLSRMVGMVGEIDEVFEDGTIDVVLVDDDTRIIHFVRMTREQVEPILG